MADERSKSELRGSPRELTLKTAKLHFEGAEPIACAVLNVSHTGACILLSSTEGIPDAFELVLDFGGPTHVCSVAWRSKFKLGVWYR
jgi:hypothetical protein